jgi:diguanylate cyclase (GGDEF)-like protein/PAS domain S-box-containing protein
LVVGVDMRRIIQVLKQLPYRIWFISGITLTVILWLDFFALGTAYESIWFLSLIIISLFSLYGGLVGCIFAVCKLILFYFVSEIIETFLHHEENIYLQFFSFAFLSSLSVAICVGLLSHYLRVKEIQLRAFFDNIDLTFWTLDLSTQKTMVSKGSLHTYGRSPKEFIRNQDLWKEVVYPEDLPMVMDGEEKIRNGREVTMEYRILKPKGEIAWVEAKTIPVVNHRGELVRLNGFVNDITPKKEIEERLNEIAYEDDVTGLPNRNWFNQHLDKLTSKKAGSKHSISILMIDFDNFKKVNDTLGHSFGDILLQKVSKRISRCLQKGQILSRQGGDEFLLLVEDKPFHEISVLADRIIKEMNEPFFLNGQEVFVTLSIGISVSDCHVDPDALLKQADLAMYLAKEKGKNNYQFYNEELNERIMRRTQLENALRHAISSDEFSLVYQPKVNLQDGRVTGVETLLRWNPDFGIVSPAEFIPILEETGLIVEVGEWVLKMACKQYKMWYEMGLDIPIAVNASARQLMDDEFVGVVKKIVQQSGMAPSRLEIEITESIMLDVDESTSIIEELKEYGVKIAIDDFGVGFSSLNVVKNYDIDNLKIDQSFLHDVMKKEKTAIILRSIIDIGKKLGTEVVVEGIETEEQVNFLKPLGVIGQGYYLGKPMSAEQVESYLW